MLRRRNRFSLKGTFNFGIRSSFTSATPNTAGPGAGIGGQNRTYDDGFVRVDVSGNAGGTTWNWGYSTVGQYVIGDPDPLVAPGNSLSFHTVTSLADGTARQSRDTMLAGAELAYEEVLGRWHISERRKANIGILISFGYLPLTLRDSAGLAGFAMLRTDKYNSTLAPPPIGGVVPPPGTFAGPGPLLPDAPVSSVTAPAAATSTINNRLDGSLYSFNLGPFIELPLHDRVSLSLGGGLGFVYANTTYTFNETIVVPVTPTGPVTANRSGRVSSSEWLFSGIARANLHVGLSEAWSWEIGLAYQYAQSYRSSVAGKTANLQLDGIMTVNTGLNYAF